MHFFERMRNELMRNEVNELMRNELMKNDFMRNELKEMRKFFYKAPLIIINFSFAIRN
jgi:hypothetical protein